MTTLATTLAGLTGQERAALALGLAQHLRDQPASVDRIDRTAVANSLLDVLDEANSIALTRALEEASSR